MPLTGFPPNFTFRLFQFYPNTAQRAILVGQANLINNRRVCFETKFRLKYAHAAIVHKGLRRKGNQEPPSSSGQGHLVLIQEIAGSNPAGGAKAFFKALVLGKVLVSLEFEPKASEAQCF